MAVIGAVGAAVVVIALNGSYTSVPYGGGSLAGRFEWTAVPLLLMWCPWLISRFQGSVARSGGLVAAIAALWVAQSVPIVEGHHVYFNSSNITTPWDPSTYPGWWSRFDVLLVQAASPGRILGRPWFAVLTEGALVLGAFLVALRLGRRRRFDGRVFGVGLVVVAAAATGLTSIVPLPLPAQPRHYTGADLGAPLVAGAGGHPRPEVAAAGRRRRHLQGDPDLRGEPHVRPRDRADSRACGQGPGRGSGGLVHTRHRDFGRPYCRSPPPGPDPREQPGRRRPPLSARDGVRPALQRTGHPPRRAVAHPGQDGQLTPPLTRRPPPTAPAPDGRTSGPRRRPARRTTTPGVAPAHPTGR